MEIKNNLLLKLRESKNNFTAVERIISDYVLENASEVPGLSVKELAKRSRTSDASVLRFCKTLGCSGYRDFIVQLSSALAVKDNIDEQYTDIQPGDDLSTIVKNVSYNNCKSIEDTMQVINNEEISRAVELLRSAKRIEFYGIGASGLVCMDAQQKLMRINKTCYALTDGHTQLMAAALMSEDDVAVLVSNSGMTIEILDSLNVIKSTGAKTIAITRYSKSKLANLADVVLYVSTPEVTIRSGAMGSRIAMLNIIDILFSGIASADYRNIKKYLNKTHIMLESKKVTG